MMKKCGMVSGILILLAAFFTAAFLSTGDSVTFGQSDTRRSNSNLHASGTPSPTITASAYPIEPNGPLDRRNYHEFDLEKDLEKIKKIRERDSSYLDSLGARNPFKELRDTSVYDVALLLAGYPNIDGLNPDRVTILFPNDIHAIVTVISLNKMDDSIRDQEYRIDLTEIDEKWTITWAGWRQRCSRNNTDDWVTTLCP